MNENGMDPIEASPALPLGIIGAALPLTVSQLAQWPSSCSLSQRIGSQGHWCGGGHDCNVFVRAVIFLCVSLFFS